MPKITKYKHTTKYKAPKASVDENKSFSGKEKPGGKEKPAPLKQEDRYSAKLVGLTSKEGSFKKGGISKNKKSMNDQFFDAIDRRRAKKIFDVRKRIDERVEKQQLEGLRKTGKKMLPRLGSKGAEKKFGRVRVVTPDDIGRAEQIRKQDKAFEEAGFVNTINLKKGGKIKPEDLDDELGSPPGAENYQKMFDQPESQGGDPKKRIMPKKKPKEFKKKDAPVTSILEKSTREKMLDYLKQDTPLTDKLPFRGLSPLTRARDIIKRDKPSKKSKGGLIKGFPRLAKKGF